jgi:predicted small secreted protein
MTKTLSLLFILLLSLSACSTFRGMGEDIESLGKGMQKSGE